nr:MerR family transcriptional regulator [Nanchangia anserum]
MSIGQVVTRLRAEFPTVTNSKVRFLEEQGVVSPARTATGYRKFSESDVERLRFCLASQRDTYMPLAKIVQRLRALDAGHEADIEPTARIVASQGQLRAPVRSDLTITARELRDLSGISESELGEIVSIGLVTPDLAGYFPQRALAIIHAVVALRSEGVPIRNLRYLRTFAQRNIDLAEQIIGAGRHDRSGADKERRLARTAELTQVLTTLATELTRHEVDQLD